MKKISLNIEDLFNIPTAEIFNPDIYNQVNMVSIDSRNIVKGSLFIAIKGSKFDGHNFVRQAVKNGASAVVINKNKYKDFDDVDIPVITVKDTTAALGDIAGKWRKKLQTKIIAITGSSGKTSTKELLAIMLNEKFKVNKTLANNNNHIGVPLTILSTNPVHDFLVVELGTNHFGEIEYTSKIIQPDYALITNIGDSHLEFLMNREGVLKEKLALFRITKERNGFLFINKNDVLLRNKFRNYENKITYSFLKNTGADVKGKITGYTDDGKPIIEAVYKNKNLKYEFPLYGNHNASNFLAALSVSLTLGLTKREIASALKKVKAVDKRLNVKKKKNFILIDDTYNANPESVKYALEILSRIKSQKRKIAVLGDMFELGKKEIEYHKQLLPYIYKSKVDELYTIGKRMKYLSASLDNNKVKKKHFTQREELEKFLTEKDVSYSIILVKGSRGMKMEEFVKILEEKK